MTAPAADRSEQELARELNDRINAAATEVGLSPQEWLTEAARGQLARQERLKVAGFVPNAQGVAALDTPISEIPMSVRARNCLARLGVVRLSDLLHHSWHSFAVTSGLGKRTMDEIQAIVTASGLSRRESVEEFVRLGFVGASPGAVIMAAQRLAEAIDLLAPFGISAGSLERLAREQRADPAKIWRY